LKAERHAAYKICSEIFLEKVFERAKYWSSNDDELVATVRLQELLTISSVNVWSGVLMCLSVFLSKSHILACSKKVLSGVADLYLPRLFSEKRIILYNLL